MIIRAGVSDGSTNESIVCSAPSRREELVVFFLLSTMTGSSKNAERLSTNATLFVLLPVS